MPTNKPKKILIAPLDWGLGHTARCIPIIGHILRLGYVPVVACNQWQRSFIEATFSDIEYIHLDGYNITYSKWNRIAQSGLLSQLPRITNTIKKEQLWLRQHAMKTQIDGIISDNRYGLYLHGTPSVILTHQLQVQTGMGLLPDRLVQKLHYNYLNHFSETWIPDMSGANNMGGILSQPSQLPGHYRYIGLLSRFEEEAPLAGTEESDFSAQPLLILISGPEPQRGQLSHILWQQALAHAGAVVFVDGSASAIVPGDVPPHITYHKLLTGDDLKNLLAAASMVICRSGYSSLMDLVALGKRAILIPTPGQTEQEYLAKHLTERGIFYSVPQNKFDLQRHLDEAITFPFHPLPRVGPFGMYKAVLEDWISSL